jgi:hypothetical protein
MTIRNRVISGGCFQLIRLWVGMSIIGGSP